MRRVLTDEYLRQHCLKQLQKPVSTTGVSLLKNNSTIAKSAYSTVVPSNNPVRYFDTLNRTTSIASLLPTSQDKNEVNEYTRQTLGKLNDSAVYKPLDNYMEDEYINLLLSPTPPRRKFTRAEQDERDLQNYMDTGSGINYTDVEAQNQGLSVITRDQRTRGVPDKFE